LPEEVSAAMAAGRKIEAIRWLREHTGLGLAAAKAAVEAGEVPEPRALGGSAGIAAADQLPPEAIAALEAGHTIEAIRVVRQARAIGLKEAKAIVDAHVRTHGRERHRSTALAPGEVPRTSPVRWVVVILVVFALVAVWLRVSGRA
jgi:ribosomal protein L7/L12